MHFSYEWVNDRNRHLRELNAKMVSRHHRSFICVLTTTSCFHGDARGYDVSKYVTKWACTGTQRHPPWAFDLNEKGV